MTRPNPYADGEVFGDAMRINPLAGLLFCALFSHPASAEPESAPAWDYSAGANDDESWGTLSKEFATCTLGNMQSPVSIDEAVGRPLAPLRFDYQPEPAIAQLREQTVVVQFTKAGTLSHEGVEYTLRQLRLHTPSEHYVMGVTFPLELHFIHTSASGKVLIVAVMAKEGEFNLGIEPLLLRLPNRKERERSVTLDAAALLPAGRGFYAYEGSLSWPPCTEGVEWRVLKQPVEMGKEQLQAIGRLLGRNARLHQPLYLRKIKQTLE